MKLYITFTDKTRSVFDIDKLLTTDNGLILSDIDGNSRQFLFNEILIYKIRRFEK